MYVKDVMKKWNFGIIGAGLIADFHARAIADIPNAKLLACCDIMAARAEELSNKHGGKDFRISGAEARKAVEVILAIYKSAREQQPVKLNS